MPRRRLEFDLHDAVPHAGTLIVLCDDDGRRVSQAVATVEAMGFSNVGWLDGGINRWMSLDYPTEWGVNVPSKDFGEKVEVVHHVPEIDAIELRARMDRGEKMVILDTRTPEEYRRFCIPGGRSLPGGGTGPPHHRYHGRPRSGYHRGGELRRANPQHHRHPRPATHGLGP